MRPPSVRALRPQDAAACIEAMRSNTPEFFADSEVADFERLLPARRSPYLVIDDEVLGVAACGGYHVDLQAGTAGLSWGMVHRVRHRRGLGSVLLEHRLAAIAAQPRIREVRLDTSQHSRPFYERFGFETVAALEDGYAPGLHRYDMRLLLPGRSPP